MDIRKWTNRGEVLSQLRFSDIIWKIPDKYTISHVSSLGKS